MAKNNANAVVKDTLEKVWETPRELSRPECVTFNAKNKVLYVSNQGGNASGDGFISKVSLDGKIIELKWISGLSNPCGMSIYKQKLYVADNKEVVEIDIKNSAISKKHLAEDSKSLNDIAIDDKGILYISDYKGSAIYRLTGDKMERWIDSPDLNNVNGLLYENKRLVVGTSKNVYTVELPSAKMALYIMRKGFVDGISPIGDGRYLISDWGGNINMIQPGKADVLIYSSVALKINQADFTFLKKTRMLYSPTFGNSSVIAYRLK